MAQPRPWGSRLRQVVPAGLAVAGLVAAVALAGSVASSGPSGGPVAVAAAQAAQAPRALDVLAGIPVKGKGPFTGYTRATFGEPWVDVDRNGCSTREDVLRRDLRDVVLKRGSACDVARGVLAEPYGGATVQFVRGSRTSGLVQVDHVVALADAWKTGAAGWSAQQRLAFANDPLELVAVDANLNQDKRAGDAATWLPPHMAYRCAYVARQVAVKAKYQLWMTQSEKDASAAVLGTCPDQRLPTATDRA